MSPERGQQGYALPMVLAFMVLVVPLTMGALRLASALAVDSRVKGGITQDTYSAMAGNQHGLYRVMYEPGYADSLALDSTHVYTVEVGGQDVQVSVLRPSNPPSPNAGGVRFDVEKEVTPTTSTPDTPQTFTYTITVTNADTRTRTVSSVLDDLPLGFTYVTNTTGGVTSSNPTIRTQGNGAQRLEWYGLNVQVPAGQQATLTFQASATPAEGVYCNEVTVWSGWQGSQTGATAKVIVGSPGSTDCPQASVVVSKEVSPQVVSAGAGAEVTYTITVHNTGGVSLTLDSLVDCLPGSFSYVSGSSSGMWGSNPIVYTGFWASLFCFFVADFAWQSWRALVWSSPDAVIAPDGVRTQTFRARPPSAPGVYYNAVYFDFDQVPWVTTGRTAPVEVLGYYIITATRGQATVRSKLWRGVNGYDLDIWGVE